MVNADPRLEILRIMQKEGYKTTNDNGRMFLDNNKYRLYLSNAKLNKSEGVLQVEWVLKRRHDGKWAIVSRKPSVLRLDILESDVKRYLWHYKKLGYLTVEVDNLGIDVREELTKIVQEHLNIPTLETRKSDDLDFHDVSVWSLEAALKAAFDLGLDMGYKLGK